MKLTFKKHARETGLASVGRPFPDTDIKGDGKVVGLIKAPGARSLGMGDAWTVGVIITPEGATSWKWAYFKARFDTEDAAREWVKSSWSAIEAKYPITQLD